MNNLEVPKEDKLDLLHRGTKVLLNQIPIVGGLVTEIFNSFVTPSIEKRRTVWMQEVVFALKKLEEDNNGIVQQLSNDEEFKSLLISASINAFKTHQTEKHKRLRNALVNSIRSETLYDVKQTFITFLDELTITHLLLLKSIKDCEGQMAATNEYQQLYDILIGNKSKELSDLRQMEITTFRFLLKDLGSKGLIFISDDLREIEGQVYRSSVLLLEEQDETLPFLRLTNFGNSFLEFIEAKD